MQNLGITAFNKLLIDEIHLVDIVVLGGKGLDELAVFRLEDRIVRVGRTDLVPADHSGEVFGTGGACKKSY